jgi:hypothetical protein
MAAPANPNKYEMQVLLGDSVILAVFEWHNSGPFGPPLCTSGIGISASAISDAVVVQNAAGWASNAGN